MKRLHEGKFDLRTQDKANALRRLEQTQPGYDLDSHCTGERNAALLPDTLEQSIDGELLCNPVKWHYDELVRLVDWYRPY